MKQLSAQRAIPLTQGKWAIVDAEDFELVSKFKWRSSGGVYGYVRTSVTSSIPNEQDTILMHRLIMRAPSHLKVDHKNHDPLDNRKSNLRLCTPSQNFGNAGKRKNSKQPYKGIEPWGNKWRAKILARHIGLFSTPEDAARAYDTEAIARWGEFAKPNFPRAE